MAGIYGELTGDQKRRKAGRSRYFWKDRAGKWHYHIEGKTTTDEIVDKPKMGKRGGKNTESKPQATGATAHGGRPTVSGVKSQSAGGRTDVTRTPGNYTRGATSSLTQSQANKLTSRLAAKGNRPYSRKGLAGEKKQGGSFPTRVPFSSLSGARTTKQGVSVQKAISGAAGRGRVALQNVAGGTKVYDKAASRLLKKKQKGYRP